MAKVWFDYDEAIDYLKGKDISCDPCVEGEGEYVCDLLDDYADRYDEEDEPHYKKSTLDRIIKEAKEWLKEEEDEEKEADWNDIDWEDYPARDADGKKE